MTVYQLAMVQSGTRIPDGAPVARAPAPRSASFPTACSCSSRSPLIILSACAGRGFGRLLFAVGDNPIAARLRAPACGRSTSRCTSCRRSSRRSPGSSSPGLAKTASLTLVEQSVLPSVAAAVIGGTSIMGGRGGYSGTIVGALILTVLTTLLTVLEMPEAVRQILFGVIIVAVAAAYTRVTGET